MRSEARRRPLCSTRFSTGRRRRRWNSTGYEAEHETIFQPMERLLTLIRQTSSGINHIVGAIG